MIRPEMKQCTKALIDWIAKAPTAYQAIALCEEELQAKGYEKLGEEKAWCLRPGKRYYVTKNGTSLIAFRIPSAGAKSFMISASHSDSPTFKLKENAMNIAFSTYARLNTEMYGGLIAASWFDRPLSVAGRVVIKEEERIVAKPVCLDRDLVLIPNVAIHQNRSINEGYRYDLAKDTFPLWSMAGDAPDVLEYAAQALGVARENILSSDLYLYNRTPGVIFGADEAFFAAPRIDDLMCAYTCLHSFLEAGETSTLPVCAVFDNEETGSATKQGAASFFLRDVLQRICDAFGLSLSQMLASSMMVSADNGHARHVNHPELSDADNAPALNGGVVIKNNAAQHYTTDGMSFSLFAQICKNAQVPTQLFANRSDLRGGSTLGSISNTMVPLVTVDIGAAQFAMHSSYETAGCADTWYLLRAMRAFYESTLTPCDGGFLLH